MRDVTGHPRPYPCLLCAESPALNRTMYGFSVLCHRCYGKALDTELHEHVGRGKTKAEAIRDWNEMILNECEYCDQGQVLERRRYLHIGSLRCRSGSIASGGHKAHCTCDTCF